MRLHLRDVPGEVTPSFEGILLRGDPAHYRLANAKQIAGADRSYDLEGEAWVPRERVLYVQVLG